MPKQKIVKLVRGNVVREFVESVAKKAVQSHGWSYYLAPPLPQDESLTDLKKRIKGITDPMELEAIKIAEQQREIPRQSIIDLCNQLIQDAGK